MGLIANPVIPDELCTLSTCSLLQAHFQYIPSLAGNAFFIALFALLLLLQIGLSIRYRTWGFLVGMIGGLVLEVLGYVGRVQMHFNPFIKNPFLMYLVCLTIAPAFLSASIYLCLARIVVVFGENLSRFRPVVYTITFIACDFLSLLLQAAGGAIASGANTYAADQNGIHIMVAGLSTQVASLALFMALCAEFAYRVYSHVGELDPRYDGLRQSRRFRGFLYALGVATFTIFVRSIFRVAELSQGFHGKLANQQVTFMILEGAMIAIAALALTIFHPGWSFAGYWGEADFKMRKSSGKQEAMNMGRDSQEVGTGEEK